MSAHPASGLVLALPILAQLRQVEGCLEEAEADLLIAVATCALLTLPQSAALVEIGRYSGRSTVVLGAVAKALDAGRAVHAIDPREGVFSGGHETRAVPTLGRLRANLSRAGGSRARSTSSLGYQNRTVDPGSFERWFYGDSCLAVSISVEPIPPHWAGVF